MKKRKKSEGGARIAGIGRAGGGPSIAAPGGESEVDGRAGAGGVCAEEKIGRGRACGSSKRREESRKKRSCGGRR